MSWARMEPRRAGRLNGAPRPNWRIRRSRERPSSRATGLSSVVKVLVTSRSTECSFRRSSGRATDGSGRGRPDRRLIYADTSVKIKCQVMQRLPLWTYVAVLAFAAAFSGIEAQGQGSQAGQLAAGAQATARASAPKDFTGYWVSVVSEQWHLRMLMPPKGEYAMLPLNAQARTAAEMWTPAQDTGNECRGYGAAVIMRVPGRLHIHWADDNTLQIDTDSGTQTRMLHFEAASKQTPPDA